MFSRLNSDKSAKRGALPCSLLDRQQGIHADVSGKALFLTIKYGVVYGFSVDSVYKVEKPPPHLLSFN